MRDRRELVLHLFYVDGGDGRPGEPAEQDPAQGVAHGGAESRIEGFGDHTGVALAVFFDLDMWGYQLSSHGALPIQIYRLRTDQFSALQLLVLHRLPRVVFDDYEGVELHPCLRRLRWPQYAPRHSRPVQAQPGRYLFVLHGLLDDLIVFGLLSRLGPADGGTDLDVGRGHAGLAPVNAQVPVVHQLPGLGAGIGEAPAVDDVVEPGLEQTDKVVTGYAGASHGLGVVAPELALEDAVGEAGLLLLPQLHSAVGDASPAGETVAGRLRPLLEGALGVAPLALEHQRVAVAPAQSTYRSSVSSHLGLSPLPSLHPPALGRAAAVVRHGGDVADAGGGGPGALKGADRRFSAAARPFDEDIHLPHPLLHCLAGRLLGRPLR